MPGLRYSVAVVLILSAVLLAGCLKLELNIRVHPDGSAEQDVLVAVDQKLAGLMLMGGNNPLAEFEREFRSQPGARVQQHFEGGYVGFRGSAPVRQFAEFGGQMFRDQTRSGLRMEPSVFWRDYILDAEIDLRTGLDPMAAALLSQPDIRVSLQVPGQISVANGQLDSGGQKVTWRLMPGRTERLTLRTRGLGDDQPCRCSSHRRLGSDHNVGVPSRRGGDGAGEDPGTQAL